MFTSNQHPRYWYKPEVLARHCGGGYDTSPLKARFDEFATFIHCFPGRGVPEFVPDGPSLAIIDPVIEGQPN